MSPTSGNNNHSHNSSTVPKEDEIFSAVGESENNVMQIESLCMNCQENGITRMLLVHIPYFKRIVVSSFECMHCNYKDEQIQSAEPVAEKGISIELKLKTPQDLNRHIVRQDSAEVIIPHLEFSSPAAPSVSMVATIEGLIYRFIERLRIAIDGLNESGQFEVSARLAEFVVKLNKLITDFEPFTLIIDDPAGNSFIENLMAPNNDPNLTIRRYTRTQEQCRQIGLQTEADLEPEENPDQPVDASKNEQPDAEDEVEDDENRFFIPSNCSNCSSQVITNIQKVDVPYFKQVLIMSYYCDNCGFRTNEVKPTNSVEDQGARIILKMEGEYDLRRDLLKSEFCTIKIPELDVELGPGTMGSKFTTVDSFFIELKEKFHDWNPFSFGDAAALKTKDKISKIYENIDLILSGQKFVTFELDDPSGSSYIQNLNAPDNDPQLTIEKYDRTKDDDDFLGLTGMKTENY